MDFWKYYDITHRDHVICNPMSSEKIDELVDMLQLPPDSRVLDIATGKAEFIIRLVERHDVSAIGIDLSPFYLVEAKTKIKERIPNSNIELIEMDGADYIPEKPESFDLVSCLGASWIYKGYEGTLKFMIKQAKPGGIVILGEPYWIVEPPKEYFDKAKEVYPPEDLLQFGTHHENVKTGENLGLTLIYCLVSNRDDWDRYLNLQWNATNKYIRSNPDDPEIPEMLNKLNKEKELYLEWEREIFGWAIYVFRKN